MIIVSLIFFFYLLSAHWPDIRRHCDFIDTSFLDRARASVRIFVYSNHRILGINVVSRSNRYSDIRLENISHVIRFARANEFFTILTYHETIIGNVGVRTTCVTTNHTEPNIIPMKAPYRTWETVWYNK